MKYTALTPLFSVCKVKDITRVDFTRPFVFLSKTDEEISLVCETDYIPENATHAEHGWRAFRVDGMLDFGLVGIIASITQRLARAGISVFVISTYNTDYVLLKEHEFEKGIALIQLSEIEFNQVVNLP